MKVIVNEPNESRLLRLYQFNIGDVVVAPGTGNIGIKVAKDAIRFLTTNHGTEQPGPLAENVDTNYQYLKPRAVTLTVEI